MYLNDYGWNKNSGYVGNRYSIHAEEALEKGFAPMSHWNKSFLLETIEEYIKDNQKMCDKLNIKMISKCSFKVLRDYFLEFKEWHHMGKYCTEIDFYGLNEEVFENFEIDKLMEMGERYKKYNEEERQYKKEELEKKKLEKVKTRYYTRSYTIQVGKGRWKKYETETVYLKTKNIDPYQKRLKNKWRELNPSNCYDMQYIKKLRHVKYDAIYHYDELREQVNKINKAKNK